MKKLTLFAVSLFFLAACVDENQPANQVEEEVTEIFTIVEQPSTFNGGQEALDKFIELNIDYPQKALSEGIGGKVYIQFVVDKNGKIVDPQIVRGIGYGADEAVLEAIKNSPNWIPGEQRGRKVNSRQMMYVLFNISDGTLSAKAPTNTNNNEQADRIRKIVENDEDAVFEVVEEQASFEGGMEGWKNYLQDNLNVTDYHAEGRVYISFIVGRDGAIRDAKIAKGIHEEMDKLALAAVENSPNWLPGKQRGVEVDSRMTVAITFKNQ